MKFTIKTFLLEAFTLLVIFSVFIFILIPTIQLHKKRQHYQTINEIAKTYQKNVEACFDIAGELIYCNANSNGLPANITKADSHPIINTLTIEQGEITITPRATEHIDEGDTLVISPHLLRDKIHWSRRGKSVEKGYAN